MRNIYLSQPLQQRTTLSLAIAIEGMSYTSLTIQALTVSPLSILTSEHQGHKSVDQRRDLCLARCWQDFTLIRKMCR